MKKTDIKTKDVEKTKSTTSGTTTGTTVIGMSGTTAKTALTDSIGRKGTKIIVTSLSSAARSSANTGSGATVIQIPTGTSQPIELSLTHEDLANLIGTTRETVTVQLNKFGRMGILRRRERHLVVNRPRLTDFMRL